MSSCYVILFSKLKKQPHGAFYKKTVVENFAILIGKQLCWSLLSVKLQGCRTATLLKIDLTAGVFREKHLRTAASKTRLINTKLLIKVLLCKIILSKIF